MLLTNRKLNLLVLMLLAGVLSLTAAQPATVQAYGGRTPASVVAFYYPWYDVTQVYNVWQARGGEMASQPASLYHSGDVNAMRTQMQQAYNAGIDAFAVTVNGNRTPEWTSRLRQLLDNAPRGFSLAAHFEVSELLESEKNIDGVVRALRDLQQNIFTHPAYFRYQGRPVLYVWWPQGLGGDVKSNWVSIRNQVDPSHNTIWSVDTINEGLLDAFDTIHFFSGAKWANNTQSEYSKLKSWANNWNSANPDKPRRLATSSLTPGYDDSRVLPKRVAEFRDRENGNYYRRSWDAAIAVQPDLVTISTWNEWFESSAIEPGRDWGDLYTNITKEKAGVLKGYGLSLGDASILKTWRRPDLPVVSGQSGGRSWMWGPELFALKREPYNESPGGARMVYYFDKSRMEINRPGGPPDVNDLYYITNGLLPIELMSGMMQTGDNQKQSRGAAAIPVAGDSEKNPGTPTYAALGKVSTLDGKANKVGNREGELILATLTGDGQVGSNAGYTGYNAKIGKFISEAGHNIAGPFWDFMNRSGPVFEDSSLRNGQIVDWLFAMGYPVSEPYWVRATVGGKEKDVLVQAFERRVLTYTPSNDDAFKVEMGNVGRHYYAWRYR